MRPLQPVSGLAASAGVYNDWCDYAELITWILPNLWPKPPAPSSHHQAKMGNQNNNAFKFRKLFWMYDTQKTGAGAALPKGDAWH